MIQHRAKPIRHRSTTDEADQRVERLRTALLALLVAIYVARPLLPSETPTTMAGDGLPFVLLTLILAATWSIAQLALPGPAVRFRLVDWAWIGLLVWQAASTCLATRSGYARGAINGFWEWAGLGVGFLLLRQLLHFDWERRAIAVVMIGLALTVSADGIYQFAIEHPATREMYRTHPEQLLRGLGIDAPPGSPARMLFENRLRSSEPTATFALANSLAGFLAPWLLMTLAIGWLAGQTDIAAKSGLVLRWGAGLCALPMALCLVLTKSRSGYLAVLAGFVALLLVAWRSRQRIWQVAIGAAFIGAILLAIGFLSGALDREMITESLKSLSYRWHYWHGALRMAQEHPWFGCGPGNFQDEYTRFKLPEASEVVADPHDFAFEIWATCGTPALMLLAVVLLAGAVESYRIGASRVGGDTSVMPLVGGIMGLVLALAVGLFSSVDLPWRVFWSGLAILPAVTALFLPWIRQGQLPSCVPSIGAAAVVVNLLAAGGISFAGVGGSLWLLLAMSGGGGRRDALASPRHKMADGLPSPSPKRVDGLGRPSSERWAIACTSAALVALAAMCYTTAYRPVLECRRMLGLAESEPARAREHLVAATEADPWADEPWQHLAEVDFARWRDDPVDELSDHWRREQREVVTRRPHSSSASQEAADRSFAAYRASGDPERKRQYLDEAVSYYRRAVELYPNYSLGHARLALALAEAGDGGAGHEAIRALELDKQTPHADLKLRKALRGQMEELARTTP